MVTFTNDMLEEYMHLYVSVNSDNLDVFTIGNLVNSLLMYSLIVAIINIAITIKSAKYYQYYFRLE